MKFILIYLVIINVYSFQLMLTDKRKAQKRIRRIPESTLLTSAVVGGSFGMLAGMYCFRHKTRHLKFTLGVPAILLAQLVFAFFFFRFL